MAATYFRVTGLGMVILGGLMLFGFGAVAYLLWRWIKGEETEPSLKGYALLAVIVIGLLLLFFGNVVPEGESPSGFERATPSSNPFDQANR